jgi:hypothetical protein
MPCEPAPPPEEWSGDSVRAYGVAAAAAGPGPGEAGSERADPFHHDWDWAYWPK